MFTQTQNVQDIKSPWNTNIFVNIQEVLSKFEDQARLMAEALFVEIINDFWKRKLRGQEADERNLLISVAAVFPRERCWFRSNPAKIRPTSGDRTPMFIDCTNEEIVLGQVAGT